MKQSITVIILLLTLTSFGQEKDCSNFKIGEFTYSDSDYADLITIRTDSLQTDRYPEMGWELISKVKWLTKCKYEIEYVKVNKPILESIIGTKYVIEIIEINENKILCKTEPEEVVIEMIKSTKK